MSSKRTMIPIDTNPALSFVPSELVQAILGLLEDAGAPEYMNDQICKLIEDWEKNRS